MQRRIIIAVVLSMLIILISLGVISQVGIGNSIRRSLDSHRALADIVSRHVDYILSANLTRLYDLSATGTINLADNDWEPEKRALRRAYEYSIFTNGLFLLDLKGDVVITYPHNEDAKDHLLGVPWVGKTLAEMKPVISGIYTLTPSQAKVIFALVPLTDADGNVIGVAGGMIDPTSYLIVRLMQSIPSEPSTSVELVDSNGIVISSTDPSRVLTGSDHNRFLSKLIAGKESSVVTCHSCHTGAEKTEDILAFTPLSVAPWGIAVREAQEIVFAPATTLRKGFVALSIISIFSAVLLGVGLSRSIVRPVRILINAAGKIGKGNLSEPVSVASRDEIGTLARSFDDMRRKLAASLEDIHGYTSELEERVAERTREIRDSQQKIETLFKKIISSQEEERKRIARELHDEILQQISAFLIKLDLLKLDTRRVDQRKLEEMRAIAVSVIDNIHGVIQDLRPSILDDLGLEAGIKWLLDKHLAAKGVHYSLSIDGTTDARFDPQVEIILFRTTQEAIINIARHADAKNVVAKLTADAASVTVDIEDDGKGFDLQSVLSYAVDDRRGRGLGLLGMKERAALIGGHIEMSSTPGHGTKVRLQVPLKKAEDTRV